MAIEKITAPSAVPASISDWEAVLDIQAALLLAVQGAERIVGSNVVKGAVFLVGGATYLATADTAITGSASDYVKLTPSLDGLTLEPSYVADLTGVTWDSANNGYYDVDGNLYVLPWKEASHGKKIFTESGEWVIPVGVSTVWITGCGRGGNGGNGGAGYYLGSPNFNHLQGGGGGGGGSGAICFNRKLTLGGGPGSIVTITIGATPEASSYFGSTEIKAGKNGAAGADATSSGDGAAGAGGDGGAASILTLPGKAGIIGTAGKSSTSGGPGGGGGNGYGDVVIWGLYGGGAPSFEGEGDGTAGDQAIGWAAGGGGGGGGRGSSHPGGAGGAGGASFIVVEW